MSLIAEKRYAASEPASIRVAWKGRTEDFVVKPVLYALAVGVSAYERPEPRLGLAAKDARDFAMALEARKGKLYRDVQIKGLVDRQASEEGIRDGLDWLEKATTARDAAMIFLSGRGVNDKTGIYFYLPVGADLDRLKSSSIPFNDAMNTVQALAGKTCFFLDTRHAGDVTGGSVRRGGGDINAVVDELASAESGAVVLSSSTGRQYSLENAAWGNGAFTKALVEGLSGKADFTGTGRITVNMLDLYISERVKELTGGNQTPTTTKPANVPDFPVAMRSEGTERI